MVAKALHAGQPQARQKTPAGIMEWTPPTLITASVGPRWKCIQPSTKQEESETKITTVGVDIAKSVFHVVGVNDRGKAVMKKQVRRKDLLAFVARLEPCRIALEACAGAHYWAREFQQHGHEVKLIAPQYVKPYVKGNKNDYNDAEAIAEAAQRPTMRFVPIKNQHQQDIQAAHRLRERGVKERTAVVNQSCDTLPRTSCSLSPREDRRLCR